MKGVLNKKLTVFGGEQYRPIIHVKDVAKVITDNIGSKATGIYNLHYVFVSTYSKLKGY